MDIEPEYAELIHEDATAAAAAEDRPQRHGRSRSTPGPRATTPAEGSTIPLAQTQPNVNPDEILATLDADTRDYLALLLKAGGEGLGGQGTQLSAGPAPLRARSPATWPGSAARSRCGGRTSGARSTTSASSSRSWAQNDAELAAVRRLLQRRARPPSPTSRPRCGRPLQELPPTLRATEDGLARADRVLARRCAPPLLRADPGFAGAEAGAGVEPGAVPRDACAAARPDPPVHPPGAADGPPPDPGGSAAAAHRDRAARRLRRPQRAARLLAFNPPGARGGLPLLALPWLNHNFNSIFLTQDAEGPVRRGLLIVHLQHGAAGRVRRRRATTSAGDRACRRPRCPTSAEICPPLPDSTPDAKASPIRLPAGHDRRLRAVVLRAAAVPLDLLRRPDPAEGEGLPVQGPVHRGQPARDPVRRADLRRLGRQGDRRSSSARARTPTRRWRRSSSTTPTRRSPPTRRRSCARRRCSARPTSS